MKLLLSTLVLAGSLLFSPSSVLGQSQTPVELNSSTIAFVEDPALLWSTYTPQLYFGIKPRLPKSITNGLIWFGLNDWEGLQRELDLFRCSFLLPLHLHVASSISPTFPLFLSQVSTTPPLPLPLTNPVFNPTPTLPTSLESETLSVCSTVETSCESTRRSSTLTRGRTGEREWR